MSSNSSWVPNEDPQTLLAERGFLQGAVICAIAYGITIPLYFLSFHLLIRDQNRVESNKRLPLLIYITVLFLLGTFFVISEAAFTQMAFIDDRNYPGGPSAFENNVSTPIDEAGNAVYVLSNWFCDALVVWRFKVIYQSCRVPIWIVMFFPYLMLAGSVAMGIMCLIQDSNTNPFATNSISFTLPYGVISLALNVILTIAIVLRLLSFRYRIVSVMGPNHGTHYTSIVAMIIESAAFFSAVAITFLVLYWIGNPVSQVFLESLTQFQTISTLLIVFRVAQGKGWTEKTAAHVMTDRGSKHLELPKIKFASPGASDMLASSGEMEKSTGGEFQDGLHISNNFLVLRDAV